MLAGSIEVPCPECGHKTPLAISELDADQNPQLVCGGCGKTIFINADKVRAELKGLRDSIDNLKKALNKGGWKTRKV